MPKGHVVRRIRFSDRTLRAIKPPASPQQVDYFDSFLPGFGMRVSYNGRKSWIALYRCNGLKRRLTIGRVDLIRLVDAREKARIALKDAADGKDPAAKKRIDRDALTFQQLATRYIDEYAKPRKRSWKKDQRLLTRNLVPELGRKKAHTIMRAELRDELTKIKNRPAPIEANRTLEVVRKLYNWAIDEELVTENPAARVPKPAKEGIRERSLTADEIQKLWQALDKADLMVRNVFRLMLLSLQRRNEITHMRWDDLDLRDNWWNIPAGFTKTKAPYRVPLTAEILKIIEEMREEKLDPVWVFPRAAGDGPVPETNITRPFRKLIESAGIASFVPHDLLHTATSHMTSMGISEFDIGKVRHHSSYEKRTSTSRYNHYHYDREKRKTLEAWTEKLIGIVSSAVSASNVTELPRATSAKQ